MRPYPMIRMLRLRSYNEANVSSLPFLLRSEPATERLLWMSESKFTPPLLVEAYQWCAWLVMIQMVACNQHHCCFHSVAPVALQWC